MDGRIILAVVEMSPGFDRLVKSWEKAGRSPAMCNQLLCMTNRDMSDLKGGEKALVRKFESILGYVQDAIFSDAIHHLDHDEKVEYLTISPDDVARRRIRLSTDKGTDCAIALERNQRLSDGAVLHCDSDGAIVVRLSERRWLSLDAPDKAAAMELGYFCGNLHWKIRFDDGLIHVALESPVQTYLERLEVMLSEGKALVVGEHG